MWSVELRYLVLCCLLFLAPAHTKTEEADDDFQLIPVSQGPMLPEEPIYQAALGVRCPLASMFPLLPKGMKTWQMGFLKRFNVSWESKGAPQGIELNDHNYDTNLGQGNTLGFLTAQLSIDPSALLQKQRIGLFEKAATYPVVARVSDFGADGATQLQRIALKFPWAASWAKEMNLLFTETVSTFPLANYRDIATNSDDNASFWDSLVKRYHGLAALFSSVRELWSNMKNANPFVKNFYSQVPYALGDNYAIRLRLRPIDFPSRAQKVPLNGPDDVQQTISLILCQDSVTYALEIQINDDPNSDLVQRNAHKQWPGEWVTVGKLLFPRQLLSDCESPSPRFGQRGLNVKLLDAIQSSLRLNSNSKLAYGLHKSFLFHPAITAYENRPIGEVNGFRTDFYSHHAANRFRTLTTNFRPFRILFDQLSKDLFNMSNGTAAETKIRL
eukprot:TRINITY_DN4043_c0_g1_i1.p1 TRINITY_DN4043_c0_g1~~TRINITY_DN4043_c0_g1_i1.p1  ORF type:complete len:454 (+),score=131.02 TRINITY_DN4043_c0_g1_i1:35-1363(+)